MSWPALKWALLKRLPAPQKSTLITLARRDPELNIHLDTLAAESGLKRSGVRLAVAALEQGGLISVSRRTNRPNRFILHLTCATHDVSAYEVSAHDEDGEDSRGECLATHDVSTNKDKYKERSTKTLPAKRGADPRHALCKQELAEHWIARSNFDLPWGPADAKQLSNLLESAPNMTPEQFRACLKNRNDSEGVNHAQAPHRWLSKVTDYSAGPLDRYEKPLATADVPKAGIYANHQVVPAATQRVNNTQRGFRDAARARGWGRSDPNDADTLDPNLITIDANVRTQAGGE